jgi:hypothetical protein
MTAAEEQERKLFLSFILPERRNRYLELLDKARRRKHNTSFLAHFKHLDMRYVANIANERSAHFNILRLLKMKAHTRCVARFRKIAIWIRKELPFADALSKVVGAGMGTFLHAFPGNLHASKTKRTAGFSNIAHRCIHSLTHFFSSSPRPPGSLC